MTFEVGSEFAGYRILRLLGEGGFASVYEAEDLSPHLQRTVALKVLRPHLARDAMFQARFLRESRAAAALNHPNIVPVFAAGQHDDQLYLAMQLVDGPDLATLIEERGPLPLDVAATVISGTAAALDAAHHAGLVHRDVKPGNILLRQDLQHAYLGDFGLVKHSSQEQSLTGAGDVLGTMAYVAPEQIEGRPVTPRTDTYSLGCALYECLTGRAPFAGLGGVAILNAHLSKPPPSARELAPHLPTAVDDLLARSMAKDPDRRPTCGELAASLRSITSATSATPAAGLTPPDVGRTVVGAGPAPGPPPGSGSQARRRRPIALLAAGAVVLVVLVVALLVLGRGDAGYPTDDERALLDVVPAGMRPSCERHGDPVGDSEASIRCSPADPEVASLVYTRMPDRSGLRTAFGALLDAADVEPDSGRCGDGVDVEAGYVTTGGVEGRVLCHRDAGRAVLVWTVDEQRVLVEATGSERDHEPLHQWWVDLLDVVPPADHLQELLGRIPEGFRDTCEDVADQVVDFALAAVDCFPASGAQEARYVLFDSRPEMNSVYEAELGNSEVPRGQGSCDTDIAAEGTYSIGEVADQGRLLCFRAEEDSPFPFGSWIIWTHDELLVLVIGWRPDFSDLTLFEWWQDAGPL